MSNKKQTYHPSMFNPIVRDLSNEEYENPSACCGEVFGFPLPDILHPGAGPLNFSFQESDSNPFCPCDVSDSDGGHNTSAKSETTRRELKTPIKKNRHEKRDTMATVATSESDLPENGLSSIQKDVHPLQATPCRTCNLSLADNDDTDNAAKTEAGSLRSPPRRKKMHLRQRSKQLMLFLTRSNSMSSSKDMSITETSMESQPIQGGGPQQEQEHVHYRFEEKYRLVRRVFQCQRSDIWECTSTATGFLHCVKIVRFPEEDAFAELEMLSNLRHPGLVRLVESFHDDDAAKLYMVMEWEARGNLLSKVLQDGPMDEQNAKAITRSIVESCVFLHSEKVVHADLCPANILLPGEKDDYPAKIADFGSACDLLVFPHGYSCGSLFGLIEYLAPEVLQESEPYGTQSDIWSVGCLVYFMLTRSSPFEVGSSPKMMTRICRAEYNLRSFHFQNVSREAKQFISSLLHTDPSVRMTAAEALEHPWLRVEKPKPRAFHRRRSSLGNHNHQGLSPLDDTLMMTPSDRQMSLPSQSSFSPGRKSGKKHHRRLSSLSKGIGKLFSPKDQLPASQLQLSVFSEASSTYSSVDLSCPRSPSAMSVGVGGKSPTRKHHRRLITG